MSNKLVRIKPAKLLERDQSDWAKDYTFDGTVYHLNANRQLSIPEEVATAWAAHDTDVEIVTDPAQ